MMDLAEFLAPENITARLRTASKEGLLRELADRASRATRIPPEVIFQAIMRRERLGSTGIGKGIAIPHANISPLAKPIGIFVRLDRPMEYEAIDGQPVDLVFLLLTPDTEPNNLPQLATITRALRNPSCTLAIRRAQDSESIMTALDCSASR